MVAEGLAHRAEDNRYHAAQGKYRVLSGHLPWIASIMTVGYVLVFVVKISLLDPGVDAV